MVLFLLHAFFDFSTVAFRLGEVMDPRAKLYMILHGKKGDSGKIYLAPSDGKKFEPGRLYTVSANIRDIGPVSCQTCLLTLSSKAKGVVIACCMMWFYAYIAWLDFAISMIQLWLCFIFFHPMGKIPRKVWCFNRKIDLILEFGHCPSSTLSGICLLIFLMT